ncbi:MAG: carbohydrate binding family 9 domain-containing protein [Acidobacteria bacterium]|nr:carbohydrate binding family 9 domain-containing protein [Acidobacteriota bacterium]MBV9475786.1 carbohydrate binding family 9 domain-containing protein [Acidobacteriota bacterium]
MTRRILLNLLIALACALPAVVAGAGPLTLPHVAQPPRLEDFTAGEDAATHTGMAKVTELRQNVPGDGDPVSLATSVYLGYDATNLYVGFVCKDDPKLTRARIVRREEIFGDEGLQIFLDTFHDKQRAYVFAVNPYGVQLDGIVTEGQGYDFNFDTLWYSEGRMLPDGFAALLRIPFKSLRFSPGPSQTWGVAVSRIIPRRNEFAYWPYITSRVEGFVPQFATMEIPEAISPGRNYQVIPYSVLTRSRLLDQGTTNPGYFDTTPGRIGLDGKFVLKNSLAADVTINPDFSEVESDEPQVIVNQRFEVFFPEKRPFFLENSGFFGTPVNLFFSRRIADPRAGARLTGRLGRWAVGGLAIDDRAGGLFLPPGDPGFGDRANIAVARMQRDFGVASNAGFLFSTRNLDGHSNQVGAFDGRFRINDLWSATAQLGASRSDLLGAHSSGTVGFLGLARSGRAFNYSGQYYDVSRDFNADLGFIPRTDIRQTTQNASYTKWRNSDFFISHGPIVASTVTWDHSGVLQDWSIAPTYDWTWTRATDLQLTWEQSYELFAGQEFNKHFGTIYLKSEATRWLTAHASYSQGTGVNYFPANGITPFLADRRLAEAGVTLSPFSRLRFDETFIYDDLRTRDDVAGFDAGTSVFRNPITRTKINYQFNKLMAVRLIVDTNALTPNEQLVDAPHLRHVTGDLLFSYVLNPGTVLYLGYSDNYDNVALLEGPPRNVVATRSELNPTARQFFLKVSYLLRY